MNEIEQLVTEFKEVQKAFQEKAKDTMKKAFTQFFLDNPNVTAIRWTQYTPYFNDGDPCEFRTNDFYFHVEGMDDDSGDYEDGFETSWFWDNGGKLQDSFSKERLAFDQFTSQITKIPDDVFLQTFGDHVQITATRDGFDVEEYSHD